MAFNDIQCNDVNKVRIEECIFADTSGPNVFFRGSTTASYLAIPFPGKAAAASENDTVKKTLVCQLSKFRIVYANSVYMTRVDDIIVRKCHFQDIR